jgi:rod shape-determining protein MreD
VKPLLYVALVCGVVPMQVTLLQSAGLGGIRPDLCLIAACLIGILEGELEGLLVGLALGYVQDLFSAGEMWVNLLTKGLVGCLAGLAGSRLTQATPVSILGLLGGLSLLSGVILLIAVRTGEGLADQFYAVWSLLLPEAAFNAALGMAAYWLLAGLARREGGFQKVPPGFLR